MSPCFPPSQELGPRAELAALCQPLKTTSDVEGIAGSFRAANWHKNPPAKSRRPSQGADHLLRSSSRVTTRWTTGRPQPAPRCHHHSRRGFCLPMQRGAGSSLSLSLSLSQEQVGGDRALPAGRVALPRGRPLLRREACSGVSGASASPRGSVLGQPLLGVKRVRGCTPTADASMLHVSYTSLEVPSWLYTKNANQDLSVSPQGEPGHLTRGKASPPR